MSYYCEMCGRELNAKTAKKAVVEGSLLMLCQDCYTRLSKSGIAKEPMQVQKYVESPASTRRADAQPRKRSSVVENFEVVEDYALVIKKARERLGWTQDILAQKVGESTSTIKRIESGRLKPSIELARKLEKILGVKLLEPVVREYEQVATGIKAREVDYLTLGDIISVKEKEKKGV